MLYEAPRKDPMFEDRSRGRIMDASNRATRFLFHASATLLDLKSDIFTYILYQGSPLFYFFRFTSASSCSPCAKSTKKEKNTEVRKERITSNTTPFFPPFFSPT